MVMRVASLCAVLAIATGLSVSQTPDVAKVPSTLGQTLLLEVQQKLEAGFDTADIEKVIGEIGDRINAAQEADTKQHNQVQENCTIDKQTFADAVNEALAKIREIKTTINEKEAAYDQLVSEAGQLEEAITQLEKEIADKMDTIEKNRVQREAEHQAFVNRSTDTTTLIAAIEQIMGLQMGSSLKAKFGQADKMWQDAIASSTDKIEDDHGTHKDEDKDTEADENDTHDDTIEGIDSAEKKFNVTTDSRYKTIDGYQLESQETLDEVTAQGDQNAAQNLDSDASRAQTAFLQLTAMAKSVTDPTTKAFLETAAEAASTLGDDEMDKLLQLFDELRTELSSYTDTLILDEKQAALDHLAEEYALTETLRSKQSSKQTKQDRLEAVYREKHEIAKDISNLRAQLDNWVEQRNDNRQLLKDRTQECDVFLKEYNGRAEDRKDELATLKIISDFVTKTIKATLDSNDRLKNEVRTTESSVEGTQDKDYSTAALGN